MNCLHLKFEFESYLDSFQSLVSTSPASSSLHLLANNNNSPNSTSPHLNSSNNSSTSKSNESCLSFGDLPYELTDQNKSMSSQQQQQQQLQQSNMDINPQQLQQQQQQELTATGAKSIANQMLHMIREEQNEMHSHLSTSSSTPQTNICQQLSFDSLAVNNQPVVYERDLSILSLFQKKEYFQNNIEFVNQLLNQNSLLNSFNTKEPLMPVGQVTSSSFLANHESASNHFE